MHELHLLHGGYLTFLICLFLTGTFVIAHGQVHQWSLLCVAKRTFLQVVFSFFWYFWRFQMEYKTWFKKIAELWDVDSLNEWELFNAKFGKNMNLNVLKAYPKPNVDTTDPTWLSKLIIDEQILLLPALERHIQQIIDQYYKYLLQQYRYQRFDLYELKNTIASRFIITKLLFLFRINGKHIELPQNLLYYIDSRISYFQKKQTFVLKYKKQLYSNLSYIRTQGFTHYPMFFNGLSNASINDRKPRPGESTLNWIARLTIQNKKINATSKQLSEKQQIIETQGKQLAEMKEDVSNRLGKNHEYTANYAAKLITLLTKTEISKNNFRDSGELFFSLLNNTIRDKAAIPRIPCASTLSTMVKCFILYFMQQASQSLIDSKSPLFCIIDSKSISGSGSRKALPIHFGGYWEEEDLLLHWTNGFRYPKQKNKETGEDNKELILAEYNLLKLSKYNILNFLAVDTGASAIKGGKVLRLSGQDLFRFTFTLPDLAHGISTMYLLSSNFLVGHVTCKFGSFNLIGWVLRNLHKIVTNNKEIINQVLKYYTKNTYLPLVAGSDVRFGGFANAIDSLIFFKPTTKNKYGQWQKTEHDFNKISLLALVLSKYVRTGNLDASLKRKVIKIVLLLKNRLFHCMMYICKCNGHLAVVPMLKFVDSSFCRSFEYHRKIYHKIYEINQCIYWFQCKLMFEHKLDQVQQAVALIRSTFDFSKLKRKTCMTATAYGSGNVTPCKKKPVVAECVTCIEHRRHWDEIFYPVLNYLSLFAPPSMKSVEKYFGLMYDCNLSLLAAATETEMNKIVNETFDDWFKYTQSDIYKRLSDCDDLNNDIINLCFVIQSYISLLWLRYKLIERTIPHFQPQVAVACMINDKINGKKWAKNIVEVGKEKLIQYMHKGADFKTAAEFKAESTRIMTPYVNENVFVHCIAFLSDKIWNLIVKFGSDTSDKKCLSDFGSEYDILKKWSLKVGCNVVSSLIVEKHNKLLPMLKHQQTIHEQTMTNSLFFKANAYNCLALTPEKVQKFSSNDLLFPIRLRSYLSNHAEFNSAFAVPSQQRYKQLYHQISCNFPYLGNVLFGNVRKQGKKKGIKLDAATLVSHLLEENIASPSVKRKNKSKNRGVRQSKKQCKNLRNSKKTRHNEKKKQNNNGKNGKRSNNSNSNGNSISDGTNSDSDSDSAESDEQSSASVGTQDPMLTEGEYNSDNDKLDGYHTSSDEDIMTELKELKELQQNVESGFESYFEEKKQLLLQQQRNRHRRKKKRKYKDFEENQNGNGNEKNSVRKIHSGTVQAHRQNESWLRSQIDKYTDYSQYLSQHDSCMHDKTDIKIDCDADSNNSNQNNNELNMTAQLDDVNVELCPSSIPQTMERENKNEKNGLDLSGAFALGLPVLDMFDSDNGKK